MRKCRSVPLTPSGQRSLLRELSYNLSDEQIGRMLEVLTYLEVIVDEEGPWAVIPDAWCAPAGDAEMCLDFDDVDAVDEGDN